jgi:hypothetical protein
MLKEQQQADRCLLARFVVPVPDHHLIVLANQELREMPLEV